MLFPRKVKHRKWHRMRRSDAKKTRVATRGTDVSFGSHGLIATSYGRITSRQLEATRRVIKRNTGKFGKVWIRIFPDRPYTSKAENMPMGRGKGDLEGYEIEVLPGRVLFEVDGVSDDLATESLIKGGKKLPVTTKVITR